jgi:hypothetical protein
MAMTRAVCHTKDTTRKSPNAGKVPNLGRTPPVRAAYSERHR